MKVEFEEAERQLVLMALAHLAVERPGFGYALNHVALKFDNNVAGRAEMFEQFRCMRARTVLAIEEAVDAELEAFNGPKATR